MGLSSRYKRKAAKKASKDAISKAVRDESWDVIDPTYTTPIDPDYIAAMHKKEPSAMALMVLNRDKINDNMWDDPQELEINCNYDACGDQYHTYARFEGCILGRGNTVDDARRLWFGKMQSIRRRTLSFEQSLVPPVPSAHAIECWFDGCPYHGMHTLGRLIGCVTSAGRPLDDAIRCWNHHVEKSEHVPLAEFLAPADPIEQQAPLPYGTAGS